MGSEDANPTMKFISSITLYQLAARKCALTSIIKLIWASNRALTSTKRNIRRKLGMLRKLGLKLSIHLSEYVVSRTRNIFLSKLRASLAKHVIKKVRISSTRSMHSPKSKRISLLGKLTKSFTHVLKLSDFVQC